MSDYNYDPSRREAPLMSADTRLDWIDFGIGALVIAAAASIPALGFAAWYFDDSSIAIWAVIPIIFFMAG